MNLERKVSSRQGVGAFATWMLVFASVVSWRKGAIFDGGIDGTVLAKAAVALVAVVLAFLLWRAAPARRTISPYPTLLLVLIVGISLIGARDAGTLTTNLVLVARIALLTVTILLILSVTPSVIAIGTLLGAMGTIGLLAAYTGSSLPDSRDRLGGGIPPLEPNELATLLLPPAIGLLVVVLRYRFRPLAAAALVIVLVLIYATGSRTALAMVGVAAILILIMARNLSPGVLIAILCAVVVGYAIVGLTDALSTVLLRGEGVSRLLSLNSRIISWKVVLATPQDTWAWWIGRGLAVKTVPVLIPVPGQQVFDSSWISSIAQDGIAGTAVLAAYVVGALRAAGRNPTVRALALPIGVAVVLRSFVENGLVESSVTFAVFFTLATLSWSGTPESLTPAAPPAERKLVGSEAPRVLAYPAAWLGRR